MRDAAGDAALAAPVRGILFQLSEALGAVPRAEVDALVRACDAGARKTLARLGVRLGTETVYVDGLHGAGVRRLRAVLDGIVRRLPGDDIAARARAVARGAPTIARDAALPDDFYRASGLVALGPRALAQGRAEALAAEARKLARQGVFTATPGLRKLAGGSVEDLVGVLLALGFRAEQGPEGVGFAPRRNAEPGAPRVRAKARRRGKGGKPAEAAAGDDAARKAGARAAVRRAAREEKRIADSPFAVLRGLKLSQPPARKPKRGKPG